MFKRIILHWTGGTHKPNVIELGCYHFLIHGDGIISNGKYRPEDNLNCGDGKYAAHTGGGNTGAIGIALCGMLGYDSKNKKTNYPITDKQIRAVKELCRSLLERYKLKPSDIITHYEFGLRFPKTTSAGKIDLSYLPTHPELKPNQVGDFIRKQIS